MKFKSNIEIQAGVEAGGGTGSNGQVLSSTGSGVAWINQNAVTAASDFVFFNVKNETGSTILKGKGVMAVGTNGNSGQILIDEMVANGTVEPKYFLGVLEENISNGGTARVISFGQLSQFDTRGQNGETWDDGQILWCDPANPGDFTITEPDGPNVKIAAAFIVNSSTNGKIQVRVQANEGIHDLHDTKITSQVDGDVLVWDNTTGVWFNDSTLNVDYTNGRVGIGTTSPSSLLTVSGAGTSGTSVFKILGSDSGTFNWGSSTLFGNLTSGKNVIHLFGLAESANNSAYVGYKHSSNGSSSNMLTFGLYASDNLVNILANGNVGIGTTSPTANLSVVSPAGTDALVRIIGGNYGTERDARLFLGELDDSGMTFEYDGVANIGYIGMNLSTDPTGSWSKRIQMSRNGSEVAFMAGNVGIGTSSPNKKLTIYDNSSARLNFNTSTTGNTSSDGTEVGISATNNNAFIWNYENSNFYIGTNNTERMRITSTGNVGIGTTSPSSKLHVYSSGEISRLESSTTTMYQTFRANGTNVGYIGNGTGVISGGSATDFGIQIANNFVVSTGGSTERMRITSSGNVGIGTSSPFGKLSVDGGDFRFNYGNDANNRYLFFNKNNSYDGGVLWTRDNSTFDWQMSNASSSGDFFMYSYGTGTSVFAIKRSNGNVGIGTTSPSAKLTVNGDALINGLTIGRGGGNSGSNTAIGKGALESNVDGTNNIALGASANSDEDVSGLTAIGVGLNVDTNLQSLGDNCLAISQFNNNAVSHQVPHIYAPRPISIGGEVDTDIITFDVDHYAGAIVEYMIRLDDGGDYAVGTVYMGWKDSGSGTLKDARQIEWSNMSGFAFLQNGNSTLTLRNITTNTAWIRITVRGIMNN